MAISFVDPSQVPFVATFLLVFAIVFGLLSMARHEKRGKQGNVVESKPLFDNKVSGLIAIVFAFFSVLYEPLVVNLQQYMPIAAILLIVIFFIMFIKRLFGAKGKGAPADLLPVVAALAVLLMPLATTGGSDLVANFLQPYGLNASNAVALAGLIIIVLIFVAVYYHRGWPAPKEV